MSDIPANLGLIRQQIKAAMISGGCVADNVHLIAVSKGKSISAIETALAMGQKIFGENRVQEAKEKFFPLRVAYPGIELHLVGSLQTNKAEDAVELFDVIQTLDRPHLAEALMKAIKKTGRIPKLYIQINIGGEPQKSGIRPEELDKFMDFCREICGLTISGLMCIPPQAENPEIYFTHMKELANKYRLQNLSMGMSADFECAIRCGATEVRIGTAIFGKR